MGLREEKQRILPALDKATEEAKRQGFITELDLAGLSALFVIAGVLDSGMLKPMEEIKYLTQLQSGLYSSHSLYFNTQRFITDIMINIWI